MATTASNPGSDQLFVLNRFEGSPLYQFPEPDARVSIWTPQSAPDVVIGGYSGRQGLFENGGPAWNYPDVGCCNLPHDPFALDPSAQRAYFSGNFVAYNLDPNLGNFSNWVYFPSGSDFTGYLSLADSTHLYQAGSNVNGTGGHVSLLNPSGSGIWNVQIEPGLGSGPYNELQPGAVAADGSIVVTSAGVHFGVNPITPGRLARIQQDGTLVFSELINAVTPPVIGGNSFVFVGTQPAPFSATGAGQVQAYGLDGSLRWSTAVKGLPNDLLVGDDGLVYVGVGDVGQGQIVGLDQNDGDIKFTANVPGAWEIILYGGVIYASGANVTAVPVTASGYDPRSPWPVRMHDNQRTGSATAPFYNTGATTTNLSSSAGLQVSGGSVTLTATVSATAGGTIPTGSVILTDNGTTIAVAAVDSSGKADFTPSPLSVGWHAMRAYYAGDANYSASISSALRQGIAEDSDSSATGGTITGNETINGTLTASAYVGNGAGLTGVNASTAMTAYGLNCMGCVGNPQLGINYAAGDAQGGDALNALFFGGNPVSAFAPASGSPNYAPATGSPNYAPVSGSGSYVGKTGDTMTGALNLPTDGLLAGTNQFSLSGGFVGIGTTNPKAALHVWSNGTAGSFPISIEAGGWGVIGFNSTWIPNAGARQYNVNGYSGSIAMDAGDGSFRFATAPSGSAGNNALESTTMVLTNSGQLGIGTTAPSATLEVNGTAKFDSTVTFASGQTFPGTITGLTAGAGLLDGGTPGNVSLSIPSAGVTNSMLANSTVTVNAGAGLAGGGTVPLGGTTTVSLASQTCAAGTAVTAHPFTCSPFAGVGANTFTGNQTMPGLTVSGSGSFNAGVTGISSTSGTPGVYGINNSNTAGVFGYSSSSSGVAGQSNQGAGVAGLSSTTSANLAAGVFVNSSGNILLGSTAPGANVFTVDYRGNVAATGNVSAAGSVTIGAGGTPIVEYVSTVYSATLPALTSGSCTTFTTAALTGFTPGSSDTIALGLPKSLVSSLGGNLFLIYQAWETTTAASPSITIQVCNPTGSRYAGGATGTIRADVFKH